MAAPRMVPPSQKEVTLSDYQELKFRLHRKLLDRIDLETLSLMAGDRVRSEIRTAVARLVDEEKTPLTLLEKERIIEEILPEVFGLALWSRCCRIPPSATFWICRGAS